MRKLLAIFMGMMTIIAHAYDFEVDHLYYNADINTMTASLVKGDVEYEGTINIPAIVTYKGRDFDVTAINGAFTSCKNLISVSIPTSVSELGDDSFQDCSQLTEVEGMEGVTIIGNNCFKSCTNLTSINLSPNLKTIRTGAFSNCTSFTRLDIPDSVTRIEDYVFNECNSLSEINLPIGLTYIGGYLFSGCTSLSSIEIPQSVDIIAEGAFYNCVSIETITIPGTVTSIGDSAFSYCLALSEVNFEDASSELYIYGNSTAFERCCITKIYLGRDIKYPKDPSNVGITDYYSPFRSMDSLKEVVIGPKVNELYYYLFKGCYNITEIIIPASVTTINYGAFYNCLGLIQLYLEDSETSLCFGGTDMNPASIGILFFNSAHLQEVYIGRPLDGKGNSRTGFSALHEQTSLKKITIGDFVKSIDLLLYDESGKVGNSLSRYTELEELTIGSSLSVVPDLKENSNLRELNVKVPTPPSATGFSNSQYMDLEPNIPQGTKSLYSSANIWNKFWSFNEKEDLLSIFEAEGLRYHIKEDKTVEVIAGIEGYEGDIVVPAQTSYNGVDYRVTSLREGAFADTNISSITIKSSINTLSGGVFKDCKELENVVIESETLLEIPISAFEGCVSLTYITLPSSVKTISDCAFKGCTALQSFQISEGMTTIGASAFEGCTSLSQFVFNQQSLILGEGIFKNCTGLESITLPLGVSTLPAETFSGCSNLKDVTVMSRYLKDYCFAYCSSLENLSLPEAMTVGNYAFSNCTSLQEIELGSNLTSIGEYAFYNSSGLTAITIPSSVKEVGSYAFSGCSNLGDLIIEDSATPLYLGSHTSPFSSYGPEKDSQGNEVIYRFIRFYHGAFYDNPLEKVYIGRDLEYKHYERTTGYYSQREAAYDNKYDSPFYGLTTLRSVEIGPMVENLGEDLIEISDWGKQVTPDLFAECPNIEIVESWNSVAPVTVYFDDMVYNNAILYISEGALNLYASTNGWKEFVKKYEDNHNYIFKQPTEDDLSVALAYEDNGAQYVWYRKGYWKEHSEDITSNLNSYGSYPWTYIIEDGWQSGNQSIQSSSSEMSVELEVVAGQILSFDWKVSSESGYDKLWVYWNNTSLLMKSGVDEGTFSYTFTKDENGVLKFEYSKDGGKDSYNDMAWISNVVMTIPEGESVQRLPDCNSPVLNSVPYQINDELWCVITLSNERMLTSDKVLITTDGLEEIKFDNENGSYIVYNMQGMFILKTKDKVQIKQLPAGFYLINGHKVLIKQ